MEPNRLHEDVFDAVPDPLVVLDARGSVLAANAAALQLFDIAGADAGALRRSSIRLALDMAALGELVGRGDIERVPVADRSGRATGITVDVIPLPDDTGAQALFWFRVHAEALARELWTDDAVATVAHEFRNPLSSMRSALALLAAGDAGVMAAAQLRFVESVQRGVERLSRIVDGYLDLGRARAGRLSLERREHDVRELLDSVVRDVALCQPATGARISIDVPAGAPSVFVDRDRITQVLLNLVYNASRFTPGDGRVTLRAAHAGREALDDDLRVLPFEILGQPEFTRIDVEDEGIGMSAEVLEHVFERYRDEAGLAGEPGGGAHLGLHIARTLMDAHDGSLRIESRLGEGTTARVFVPSDHATARLVSRLRRAEETVQAARAARRSVTVALVEDTALLVDEEIPAAWARAMAGKNSEPALVWVLRDGLALLVTRADVPIVESWLAGSCRAGGSMTFSGAVRAAAARLLEQKNNRGARAVPGLEPVRE